MKKRTLYKRIITLLLAFVVMISSLIPAEVYAADVKDTGIVEETESVTTDQIELAADREEELRAAASTEYTVDEDGLCIIDGFAYILNDDGKSFSFYGEDPYTFEDEQVYSTNLVVRSEIGCQEAYVCRQYAEQAVAGGYSFRK